MPAFSLFSEGVDTRRCARKDVGPKRGWILGVVPHRWEEGKSVSVILGVVPHQSEEGKSASEDAGSEGGWIVMSHIG